MSTVYVYIDTHPYSTYRWHIHILIDGYTYINIRSCRQRLGRQWSIKILDYVYLFVGTLK